MDPNDQLYQTPLAAMQQDDATNMLIPTTAGSGATPQANGNSVQFKTGLILDLSGEERLLEHCIKRMSEVRLEMGVDETNWPIPFGWMEIRRRNQETYDNDLRWRVLMGGIFAESNFTLGTNKRHIRYLAARIQDDLLGTEPFMGVFGRNPAQEDLARQIETYVTQKIEEAGVRANLRQAQKIALIRNEAVVKTTWTVVPSTFWGPLDCFCTADGTPVKTPAKGLYVEKNATFLPDQNSQDPGDGTGIMLLEDDPSFQARGIGPAGILIWVQPDGAQVPCTVQHFDRIKQTWVEKEGIDCRPIDYRSFLCPLNGVKNVHEADINVHLYKETPSRMRQQYGEYAVSQGYFNWWNDLAENQAIEVMGELREALTGNSVKQYCIAETYVCFDADRDGADEQLLVVIDCDNQKLIFYDYLRNHLKKRPFEVIPGLETVADRWYGIGVMSMGEHHELLMDSQLNRAQVKESRSSSVLFRDLDAVDEWKNGQPMAIGTGECYALNPGWDGEKRPPVFKINLAEDAEMALKLMDVAMTASDGQFGSISSKDASQADLDASKTATGVVNLQQASDVITKATEQDQIPALEAILMQVVDISLENLDSTTLLLSKDGKKLLALNRDDARALSRDVRLTLTRSRSTQLFTTSQQALTILVGSVPYLQLLKTDPATARIARPLYINQLRALEVNDADDLCPEVTDEMIAQFQQAQQQQQTSPVKESVMTSYKDAPPDIRRQIEAADGFQPSKEPPPNEQPAQPTSQPARAA